MKLVLAQGNPGTEYKTTRHNVGFTILDGYANEHKLTFIDKPKFFASIAELSINGEKVLLAKPTTFYNETGKSARAISDFYKLDPESDILVVHDDIALPLGTIRTREKGSDAGNNGIKSLNAHLGPTYKRIRIGVQSELLDRIETSTFVLGTFSKEEQEAVQGTILPGAIRIINDFVHDSFVSTSI